MILHPAEEDITGSDIVGFLREFKQFAHTPYNMVVIRE
jgi:hypothetical protein